MPVTINGTNGLVTATSYAGSGSSLTGITTGKVLQVKQAVKTDTATTSSGTFADVSGLSVSITPTSASNKILVSFNGYISGVSNSFVSLSILRNSTAIGIGTEATGNRTNVGMAVVNLNASSSAYGLVNASFQFLDDAQDTNAHTYKLQWSSTFNSAAIYINRPQIVTQNRAMETYTSSSITVQEVAA